MSTGSTSTDGWVQVGGTADNNEIARLTSWFPNGGIDGNNELLTCKGSTETSGQNIGTNLAADTTYTLKVDLLNDWGYSQAALGYCIALHAGSYQPGLLYGTEQFTASDAKMELTLTTTTGDSPLGLGQPLWIELTRLHATDGVNIPYDNVRLDGTIIPEPSSAVLLASALIGLVAYAWRKRR